MKPLDCGFDGERGITIVLPCPDYPEGITYKLRRGKSAPVEGEGSMLNMLVWYHPDGQDPKLLYCNSEEQWFELNFTPSPQPFLSEGLPPPAQSATLYP